MKLLANEKSLLDTLNQKLRERNIKPGLLVEKSPIRQDFWICKENSEHGFNLVEVKKGSVLLYLGLEAIDRTRADGPKLSQTRDIFLAHKFLLEEQILYLKVGSDTFLIDFVRNFKITGK